MAVPVSRRVRNVLYRPTGTVKQMPRTVVNVQRYRVHFVGKAHQYPWIVWDGVQARAVHSSFSWEACIAMMERLNRQETAAEAAGWRERIRWWRRRRPPP